MVDYLFKEYAEGRTPNPDVLCNSQVKFKPFLEYALKRGADFVATGHYVSKQPEASSRKQAAKFQLLKGIDPNKDQSYFLYQINQSQLKHCLFPIGDYEKTEVRKLAQKYGLATAKKPDSQGICFIGEVQIKEFLKSRIKPKTGDIITADGEKIGKHEGVWYYTVGQRRGIGIGGGLPYYVVDKDLKRNVLIVARGDQDEALFKKEMTIAEVHWIAGLMSKLPLECTVKIRYRQQDQACVIQENKESKNQFRVIFKEKQRAITPGQFAVFYNQKICLGGGKIVS